MFNFTPIVAYYMPSCMCTCAYVELAANGCDSAREWSAMRKTERDATFKVMLHFYELKLIVSYYSIKYSIYYKIMH